MELLAENLFCPLFGEVAGKGENNNNHDNNNKTSMLYKSKPLAILLSQQVDKWVVVVPQSQCFLFLCHSNIS